MPYVCRYRTKDTAIQNIKERNTCLEADLHISEYNYYQSL